MLSPSGASTSVSSRSSALPISIGDDDAFFRKHVNVPASCKIKVVVAEYHNEALTFIHRSIGAKRIPLDGLKLLHVDSHPDLCIPNVPSSEIISQPYEMLKFVSLDFTKVLGTLISKIGFFPQFSQNISIMSFGCTLHGQIS